VSKLKLNLSFHKKPLTISSFMHSLDTRLQFQDHINKLHKVHGDVHNTNTWYFCCLHLYLI